MTKEELKENLLKLNIFNNNEYLDEYCNLIINNIDTKKEKLKTIRHHIIPRSYYYHRNLKINHSKENIINLSFSNHAYAHYYLILAAKDKKFKYANENALIRMIQHEDFKEMHKDELTKLFEHYEEIYLNFVKEQKEMRSHYNVKWTEERKRKFSQLRKGVPMSEKRKEIMRKQVSEQFKGRIFSEEHKRKLKENAARYWLGKHFSLKIRKKISKALKGKNTGRRINFSMSDDARKKISKSSKNKIWINDNKKINKRIDKNELSLYINQGWKRGRLSWKKD